MQPTNALPLPIAVVDIQDNPAALVLIGAVFLLTFATVALVAYRLLAGPIRPRRDPRTRSLTFTVSSELPVSSEIFDQLAAATEAGLRRSERMPESDAYLAGLERTRGALLGVSRTIAIAGGFVLLFIAASLYRQSTPANMLLLPAGILALLGVGALLKGAIPERRVEPIDPQLFDKIRLTTSTTPLTVRLDRFDLIKAAELRKGGASWDRVARAVHAGYDALSAFEQSAVQHAIEQALKAEADAR